MLQFEHWKQSVWVSLLTLVDAVLLSIWSTENIFLDVFGLFDERIVVTGWKSSVDVDEELDCSLFLFAAGDKLELLLEVE